MSAYKLLTFSNNGEPRAGLLVDGLVYDLATASDKGSYSSVRQVLNDWDKARSLCAQLGKTLPGSKTSGLPIANVELLAPVLYPSAIYCAGANYADHLEEMARARGVPMPKTMKDHGETPWHFQKSAQSATIGHKGIVETPKDTVRFDWELELAVVIGKPAKHVKAADALNYVAGYTIANDLSARDHSRRTKLQPHELMYYDWIGHKTFDGSCPTGPWITPAEEIPDPNNLDMKLWLNDELMQDSNSSKQIFNVQEQIEALSSRVTLQPGDLILTGTPAGVGNGRQLFLKKGDQLRLWIEGIGELRHGIA